MSPFDSFAVVDWSAGNDTGPKPRKDAIWLGLVIAGQDQPPEYLRNRMVAEARLAELIAAEQAAGRRLLIGFDFPFGYPAGVGARLCGDDDPLALWDFIAEKLDDGPNSNNRFHLAAELNACFPGLGPFWFNGLSEDIPGLPRKKHARKGHGQPERRKVETLAKGSFTCWQMGGAGAVGGQVMTGVAALSRLRAQFPGAISVWPFEPLARDVAFAEIWPSLINKAVRAAGDPIKDRAQVRLLARALARLTQAQLDAMLAVNAPEEGWILGLGHEDALNAAAEEKLAPPPLSNDCFALPAGVDWTPVADALARLRSALHPVTGIEEVPLSDAGGRVLAQDMTARRANPAHANAAVDGFGFAHASLGQGDHQLPLIPGRAAAGQPFIGTVPRGSALRILTGAALPVGVDTVVLEEDCTVTDTAIAFRSGIKPGANTRAAGEDITIGDAILTAGQKLRAPDMALLATGGRDMVPVHKRLRVAVLSTGDELVEPGTDGGTVDANRPMLSAMVRAWGYELVDLGRAPDDPDEIRQRLDQGAGEADAILTSGGASAGDEDHISALLRESGALQAWRIALKPGRPLALAMWQGTPVFGLPGNPVAALVCSLIFARPALSVMAGSGWVEPLAMTVPAAFTKSKKAGRNEYLRARLTPEGRAEVFASEGSGRISGLSWATGLVALGPEAQEIKSGDPVEFLPYSGFGL